MADLDRLQRETGLRHLHLDLNPALNGDWSFLQELQRGDWKIAATMLAFSQEDYSSLESIRISGGIMPDEFWQQNKKRIRGAIDLTAALSAPFLEFHFGFIESSEACRMQLLAERTRELADYAWSKKITLLMETGQESAQVLKSFLEMISHPALAVNFDPGNMVLYGKGDPKEALGILKPWIRNIHVKDAVYSKQADLWGQEVRWEEGAVAAGEFLDQLEEIEFDGVLCIEREAGQSRYVDIRETVRSLSRPVID